MAKLYLFKQKVYQMDDFIRRPPCFVDSEDEKFYCKNIKDKTDCQKCKKAQFYHREFDTLKVLKPPLNQ